MNPNPAAAIQHNPSSTRPETGYPPHANTTQTSAKT
jgi:hypothetical protein